MSKATRRARRQRQRAGRAALAAAGGAVSGTVGREEGRANAWQETAGPGAFVAATAATATVAAARDGRAASETVARLDERKDGMGMSTSVADVVSNETPRDGGGRAWQEMAGPGDFSSGGWSAKQHELALALARGLRIAEAARECQIGERTAFRWRTLTGFSELVEEYRARIFDETIGRLTDGSADAADALRRLTKSENEPVALRASQALLRNLVVLRQQVQLDERVRRLERQGGMTGPARGRLEARVERLETERGDDRTAQDAIDQLGLEAMLREHQECLNEGNGEEAARVIERLLLRVQRAPEMVRRAFEVAVGQLARASAAAREECAVGT